MLYTLSCVVYTFISVVYTFFSVVYTFIEEGSFSHSSPSPPLYSEGAHVFGKSLLSDIGKHFSLFSVDSASCLGFLFLSFTDGISGQ